MPRAARIVEASPAANDAKETVVARDRTPVDMGVILVLVAILAGLGVLLAWRAERVGGAIARQG